MLLLLLVGGVIITTRNLLLEVKCFIPQIEPVLVLIRCLYLLFCNLEKLRLLLLYCPVIVLSRRVRQHSFDFDAAVVETRVQILYPPSIAPIGLLSLRVLEFVALGVVILSPNPILHKRGPPG